MLSNRMRENMQKAPAQVRGRVLVVGDEGFEFP